MDRLSLLSKLAKAEAKIQTLETQVEMQTVTQIGARAFGSQSSAAVCLHVLQLVENSQLWGRQKQDLLTKLSEHRHGFVPATSSVLG